jgi:peptidoglycan-associated lipoprotein
VTGRAAIASAAIVSLAMLAGCQSESADETGAADVQSGAGIEATPSADPNGQDLASQMRTVGDRVYFALDRHDLAADAEATLQQQAALLQRHPEVAVTIQGHADERGTREYNLALGERRADTVRNFLMALGIPGERISVISYGKERPECAEAAERCWAQNRRGVTMVGQ